ncbi:phosphatase PAP2 family protein [Actinomycetospora rhizophila]|uniref:Phosphatase PAP2 family protein n=1 Tax=Actinomycetospora rhizophila TaxID=1416876 RepID=A0ABV9ZN42_9PSEU
MTGAPRTPVLVRPSWRIPALVVVAVCAATTAVLGVRYHGQDEPGRLDALVDPNIVVTSSSAEGALRPLILLGSPAVIALLVAGIAGWAATQRWWSAAALAVLGPGLAAVSTEFLLKPLVGRTLDGDLAFPSGHAVRVAAVSVVVLVLLVAGHRPRHRPARIAIGSAAVLLPACAAYALVALTWHYTTDAIGGVLVAVAVVIAIALVLDAGVGSFSARSRSFL